MQLSDDDLSFLARISVFVKVTSYYSINFLAGKDLNTSVVLSRRPLITIAGWPEFVEIVLPCPVSNPVFLNATWYKDGTMLTTDTNWR